MPPRKPTSKGVSYRLTEDARRLLAELARTQGISMTAVLELVIRKESKDQGLAALDPLPDLTYPRPAVPLR